MTEEKLKESNDVHEKINDLERTLKDFSVTISDTYRLDKDFREKLETAARTFVKNILESHLHEYQKQFKEL